MSPRVALVEHKRPRILAIDLPSTDIKKVEELGFNIRAGSTGLHNNSEFSIPLAIEDVEIIVAEVSKNSFSKTTSRTAHKDSVIDKPYFDVLFNEVWNKKGWIVLFAKQDSSPNDFSAIGINYIGVLSVDGKLFNPHYYGEIKNEFKKEPDFLIPKFKGQSVEINERVAEGKILERHSRSASYSILAVDRKVYFKGGPAPSRSFATDLIVDESSSPRVLAVHINEYQKGVVLVLPDYGRKNIDVFVGLLNEVIADESRNLFDTPEHTWLKEYVPHPWLVVQEQIEQLLADYRELYERLTLEQATILEDYNWLLGLLTAQGDEFANYAAEALRFLGFQVTLVDQTLDAREAKKEDYHIVEPTTNYFAIGEAKTKKRGPGKDFFIATQDHQTRYSRDHNIGAPDAILIVNHSIALHPDTRKSLFYTDEEYTSRCNSQHVIAIDSVALYSMCQCVLRGEIEPEEVRRFVISQYRLISSFAVDPAKE